jgi:4-carboxymuconolactone decarboxylase
MPHDRLAPIPPNDYDAAQKAAVAHFEATRQAPLFGPFEPLLHSPELMTRASDMGLYLRYGSAIGLRLSEFVILLIARDWSQDFEWSVHARIAADQGIAPKTIAAIADGRRPDSMTDDEAMLHDFVDELLTTRRVSDVTYARARARFGEKGVVDIVGLAGYYSLLAMVLNVARTPVPDGAATLPRFP